LNHLVHGWQRVMAKFAALKLDEGVWGHHKSEHALAFGALVHWTFINRMMDAAQVTLLPLLPECKNGRLGMNSFFES
jgi:hypothetical protein